MKTNPLLRILTYIGYLLWAVFINAISLWMIGPLVQDLGVYGVIIVAAVAIVWAISIPPQFRRRFISFTLFSLLLGQGIASLAFDSLSKTVVTGVVMAVGLFIVALWFGRVRFLPLLLGTIGIVVANAAIPFADWPFLTQFNVVTHSRLHINPHDMEAAPFEVIPTSTGQAIMTVNGYIPPKPLLQQLVGQATQTPDALQNVLRTAEGEYEFIELKNVGGHMEQVTPSPADLAKIDPLNFIKSFFPFQLAHWYTANGRVYEYLEPYITSNQAVETALNPAAYASTMQALSNQGVKEELANWHSVMQQLGVQPQSAELHVDNGELLGTYQGQLIHLPVQASSVIATGHFTDKQTPEVLLLGDNNLQVMNLDSKKVVATFKGSPDSPIPNDIVVGPLTSGGRDAIFVNASPAYILEANNDGSWQTLYRAPSSSFRFETVLQRGSGATQIVTNDPSFMRSDDPTRYFTAYRFVPNHSGGMGQLQRDWRVYRTNVVNVTPVTWQKGGPKDLAVGIYGSGEYLILRPNNIPVLPISIVIFALTIVGGFVLRVVTRRSERSE